jgi:O-antigen/teichoic acid export membrane protein
MSSVKRRLIAGLGANTFAKASAAIVPIVSVPIFLSHWGTKLYGDWLLLNAIPSYLLLSDIGFGSAAANEITMLVASGRREEAISVFQSVWVVLSGLSVVLGAGLVAAAWLMPIAKWLHISALSAADTRLIILLLGLTVVFGLQETLFQGVFRCVGKYALGTVAKSLLTTISFCGTMALVIARVGPRGVAAGLFLLNVLGTILLGLFLRSKAPWVSFGARHARWSEIRRLSSPAISFMGFPIGNALSLQGVLLVIGHVLGPVAVVTYNTARTISRTATQAMQLINNAGWPEVSSAYGAGDLALMRWIHRRLCQMSGLLCITIILAGTLAGPYLWQHWTMGKIAIDPLLLNLLFLQMFFSCFWYTSSVILAATNRHQGFALVFLASISFSLGLSWVVIRYTHAGLPGIAAAGIVGELLTSSYVLRNSLALVGDDLRSFLRSMIQLPRFDLGRLSGRARSTP